MNVVLAGIYNKFIATSGTPAVHNSFYLAVGGRMYFQEAPQNATFPYCVWNIITNDDWLNFSSDKLDIIIQFDLHSSTATAEEIGNLYTYLNSLYHKSSPTITGYRVVHFRRNATRGPSKDEDTDWWLYQVRYLLRIEPSS